MLRCFLYSRLTAACAFILSASAVRGQSHSGIHVQREIELGGVKQWLQLRGDDVTKPVLLYLHGGPGLPQMPFAYKNAELEHDFVVVHWDQRGAGKSYRPNTPNMTVAQFVSDALELSRRLRTEFGGRQIILVGHSWGTVIGALAASQNPEMFRAYVGIGQLVNIPRSENELDARSREIARAKGKTKVLAEIEALGHYPYTNHVVEKKVNGIQKRLFGRVPHDMTPLHFIGIGLASPAYSLIDDYRVLEGLKFSGKALAREIYTIDLARRASEIDVPVYLFEGRHDTVLSPIVSAQYFRALKAPRGKHLVWFEHSNHWPQLEEREKYRAELLRVIRETKNRE